MSSDAEFKQAFEDVKKLKSLPEQRQQLDLYAYAKIAKGENIEDKKVGMFDLKGKSMRNHWQAKLDEGIDANKARELYVKLVEKLQKDLGTN